jgi:gluconolactonase
MIERRSPGLDAIVPTDVKIERIAAGFLFTEGPLWTGDRLLFADIPNGRIASWRPLPEGPELTTFRSPSNLANGLTFDRERRLIACEGGQRRLTRTEAGGRVTVLADTYEGKRINSPNDVVVAADGSIYFSDPFWAQSFPNSPVKPTDRELSFAAVFRIAPDGSLSIAADDFEFPNGLGFSPDGKTLYVDDTRRFHVRAYDVRPDGSLANGRLFADMKSSDPGVPDGMKVDTQGNLYVTGPGGVWVFAPSGEPLGRIVTPEVPANVAFGDADWRSLYVTARTSVFRVRLNVAGVSVP